MTVSIYDVIVVGRGLIGSAAARHLADKGARVCLIGPGEPAERRTHDGFFGSHYDSGRIVRILDPLPHYARIAKRAIQRFRPLEEQTGIRFYYEVGYLAVSNNSSYLTAMEAQAETFYPQVERLSSTELASRFPYFHFPGDVRGLYQATDGGYLDPRRHIAAQNAALKTLGGTVIDDVVNELDSSGPVLRARTSGSWVQGEKIVLATGAFANVGGIIPRPIRFSVVPHTVVLGEIAPNQLSALEGMPCLSYRYGDDPQGYIYFLPPIQYPDGKWYVKIGHSKGDSMANDKESLVRWFQGDGDPLRAEWLTERLQELLPDVGFESQHSEACVTTQSVTGLQAIDQFDDRRIYALLTDNGQCAKSADELGYIMASFVATGRFPSPYDPEKFRLVFA